MKKQYVYIGMYYHIKNKMLPLDCKFGVANNLEEREYALSRTKSPIKYMILRAWEIPSNVKREMVEKLIAIIFAEYKYDGCEWYDIDGDLFQSKIATLFQIISAMVTDGNFVFNEVNLDIDTKTDDILEKELEKEIRAGKKADWTTLKITYGDKVITSNKAKNCLTDFLLEVSKVIDLVQIALDFPNMLKTDKNNFPDYKQNQAVKVKDFWVDTHSSTDMKRKFILSIFEKYNLVGSVEII
jgi:hypothetical protein